MKNSVVELSPTQFIVVTFDNKQTSYHFEIGFITIGDYPVAISCDLEDDPEVDEDSSFITPQNVTVIAI